MELHHIDIIFILTGVIKLPCLTTMCEAYWRVAPLHCPPTRNLNVCLTEFILFSLVLLILPYIYIITNFQCSSLFMLCFMQLFYASFVNSSNRHEAIVYNICYIFKCFSLKVLVAHYRSFYWI